MATYQSGLLGDFFRRQSQRRSLTGFPSSYQEQRGALDPMLAYDAQKTQQAGLLSQQTAQFDRQMQLQEKGRKDQNTAAMVSGVGQLAMLPMAYKSGKSLLYPDAVKDPPVAAPTPAPVTAQGQAISPAPSQIPSDYAAYDASMAEGAQAGVGDTAGTTSGSTGAAGLTSSPTANMGLGLLAGAGANYVVTQTGGGKDLNKGVAKLSRLGGMSNLSDEQYASKGSATIGGLTAGGAIGVAVAATAWDIGNLFKTGKISNELLGIPFADKIFGGLF